MGVLTSPLPCTIGRCLSALTIAGSLLAPQKGSWLPHSRCLTPTWTTKPLPYGMCAWMCPSPSCGWLTLCATNMLPGLMPMHGGHPLAAAQAVHDASVDDKVEVCHALWHTTTHAKQQWANTVITQGDVWDVVKWRHGWKSSAIATLCDTNSSLTFKPRSPSSQCVSLPRTWGMLHCTRMITPPHSFHLFLVEELWESLKAMSSTMAPGFSGQT